MIFGAHHYTIGYKLSSNDGNAEWLIRMPLPEAPGHVTMPANVVLVMNQIKSIMVKAIQIKSWTEQDQPCPR